MSAPINATPAYTRSSSTSSASSTASGARRSSSFFKAVGNKLVEHHRDVNNAYEAYYGTYSRVPNASVKTFRQQSIETQPLKAQEQQIKQQSKTSRAWESVKKHAKEHNQSVNASYKALYGIQ